MQAVPFDSQFELVKTTGRCTVRTPKSNGFVDGVERQKYPYGTILKTGRRSTAIIKFSHNNGCRVFARTTVAINQEIRNKKVKTLKFIAEGKVQVRLESNFRKHNELRVETPSAVCGAIGCDFVVAYQIIGDLRTTLVSCREGEVFVKRDHYQLDGITTDGQVAISQSPDGNFIRIRIVNGDTAALIRGFDGSERTVDLVTDDEITILASPSKEDPNSLILITRIDFADTTKPSITIEITVPKDDLLGLPPEWTPITLAAPVPDTPTPTPVGKRQ